MFYLAKTPKWIRKLLGRSTWEMPGTEKRIFLTFDDGPHPTITPFVLDELDKYKAKATFFCIGRNVAENPSVYKEILSRGHAVGNHTHNHLNGWKTNHKDYLADVLKAREYINSGLFRPPYGKITRKQHKELSEIAHPFSIIMWTVLSGDFDNDLPPQKCYENVIANAGDGAIIVFHDSEKAKERMTYALPEVLKYFHQMGYSFNKIELKG